MICRAAEGSDSVAVGICRAAQGSNAVADGICRAAQGSDAVAEGFCRAAQGSDTVAAGICRAAQGSATGGGSTLSVTVSLRVHLFELADPKFRDLSRCRIISPEAPIYEGEAEIASLPSYGSGATGNTTRKPRYT